MDKKLLNIKEVCQYTGWGETKVRELISRPSSTFAMKLGNKWFVNKPLFDAYLDKCALERRTV